MGTNRALFMRGLGLAVIAVVLASCGAATNSTPKAGKVTMAILAPLSGSFAFVGQWIVYGAQAGAYEVNHNGGVMGQQIATTEADTAGDPVDAVPAWHQLEAAHPTFEVGPTALEVQAVLKLYDSAHLPDFTIAGTTELDHMNQKYVFRTGPSDSTLAKAMAAYAIHKKLDKALLIFDNGVSSQTLVPPLESGYTKHGGKIVANLALTPDQTSYLSELSQAFSQHPNVILMQLGPKTSATVFADLRELGHLNIPVVDTDNGTNIAVAQGMGLSTAAQLLTGMQSATPNGPAFSEFLKVYNTVHHTTKYLPSSPSVYDGVVIAALAMTAAKSTNPTVWINYVTKVSNPPGVQCYSYASCVKDLHAGKKINYQGASGPEDFNQYHNSFGSGWTVVQWTTSGNLTPVYTVPPSVIAQY
ncbi:MAG TPA: ABC transporter substrate-binding protein [Candidatus Dormibacteraeota bacterium]|nr:ABC transporter substrate-binding protein [Candidatus Dormibacteraeota bacterium]